ARGDYYLPAGRPSAARTSARIAAGSFRASTSRNTANARVRSWSAVRFGNSAFTSAITHAATPDALPQAGGREARRAPPGDADLIISCSTPRITGGVLSASRASLAAWIAASRAVVSAA